MVLGKCLLKLSMDRPHIYNFIHTDKNEYEEEY